MYERQFDLEWEDLSIDEATRRAYAIGVLASMGRDHTTELKRIYAQIETPYNQSLVELSYEEGRNRAEKEIGGGRDRAEVWDVLVVNEDLEEIEPDATRRGGQSIPDAVQRATLLDSPLSGSPGVIDFPAFLRGP